MTTTNERTLIPTGEATAMLPAGRVKPITVIGTEAIRATFDDRTLQQAIISRLAPPAYKDFDEVVRSVTEAGLASEVARLRAKFVIKDASKADD